MSVSGLSQVRLSRLCIDDGKCRSCKVVPQVISARSLQSSGVASRALGYGSHTSHLALIPSASFTTRLGHYTTHIPYKQPPETSTSLAILENVPTLLTLSIPPSKATEDDSITNSELGRLTDNSVSLIRGFKATIPTSELAKQRRRRVRGGVADDDLLLESSKIGLKKLGDRARGLLTEGEEQTEADLEEERTRARKLRRRRLRKGRAGGERDGPAAVEGLGIDELTRQVKEIAMDKDNLKVRKVSFDSFYGIGVALARLLNELYWLTELDLSGN
jgi:division protein 1